MMFMPLNSCIVLGVSGAPGSLGVGACTVAPAMVQDNQRKDTVKSKAWSCSELKDGQEALKEVKKESPADLAKAIKDGNGT